MNSTRLLREISPIHILIDGHQREVEIKVRNGFENNVHPAEMGLLIGSDIQMNRIRTMLQFTGSLVIPPAIVLTANQAVEAITNSI